METKIKQTITEQLISFKTAKLAQKKGFEVIIDSQKSYYNAEGIVHHYNWFNLAEFTILIEAPTQALLQRWLREKHNYHITLTIDIIDFKYEFEVYRWKDEPNFIFGMNGSKSFQQTLEKALYNTLLLIKQTQ